MRSYWIPVFIFLLASSFGFAQKSIPPQPNTLVNDYVGLLEFNEREALERKLVAYADSTSIQIAVVIDRSLQGEAAFDYSYRLAEAWGIGQGETNNGILLYIAYNDRQLFIQTGYGAEGFLPDALAKRIIENILKPNFRNGAYYQGIERATTTIMQLGSGEYSAEEIPSEEGLPTYVTILILILLIIVIISLFGNSDDWGDGGGYSGNGPYDYGRRRSRRGGGWILMPGGGGWSGGGGGGFGGGGFGGFGGGGFG
ncbi:MAG: TPM domain-containing protein, partial [Saprospiraceae bacterium]|nr:TPM domain-containing protein [Saprospiraceae bacterium]